MNDTQAATNLERTGGKSSDQKGERNWVLDYFT